MKLSRVRLQFARSPSTTPETNTNPSTVTLIPVKILPISADSLTPNDSSAAWALTLSQSQTDLLALLRYSSHKEMPMLWLTTSLLSHLLAHTFTQSDLNDFTHRQIKEQRGVRHLAKGCKQVGALRSGRGLNPSPSGWQSHTPYPLHYPASYWDLSILTRQNKLTILFSVYQLRISQ